MATGLFVCGNLDKQTVMTTKCVIETLVETIDGLVIIDWSKQKLKGMIDNIADCKHVQFDVEKCKDWREIRELYRGILRDNNIDNLIVFKVVLAGGFKATDMGRVDGLHKALKNGDLTCGFNFASAKAILIKYFFVEVASKVCDNIYHFVLDPQEAEFEKVLKFKNFERLYGMARDGFRFIPCFEYKLNKYGYSLNKRNDFVFYCSAATDDRKHIADLKDKLEAIPNWDVQINIPKGQQKEEKKTTPLSQKQYYQKLAESRYTCCIVAYEKSAFSLYRLYEALAHDCLSFVFTECCLDDVKATCPEVYEIIKKYLLVDTFKEIKQKIDTWPESKRLEIINLLKNTNDWKKATDIEYVKDCWSKLDGINIL